MVTTAALGGNLTTAEAGDALGLTGIRGVAASDLLSGLRIVSVAAAEGGGGGGGGGGGVALDLAARGEGAAVDALRRVLHALRGGLAAPELGDAEEALVAVVVGVGDLLRGVGGLVELVWPFWSF